MKMQIAKCARCDNRFEIETDLEPIGGVDYVGDGVLFCKEHEQSKDNFI